MTNSDKFNGVFTALVTPFDETGAIDWNAFDALLDRQLEAGITGLVPVGTTGEAATLTDDEALAIISRTVKRVDGSACVLAGTGSNSTAKTIAATVRAADAGVDGVLLVTPYYNKPSQAGLIAHYEAVADCATVDNVLYSVPGRAGIEIAVDTAAHLSRSRNNIVAIKEAGGDAERVIDLGLACDDGFVIHSGDDSLALAFYALGAKGLTSVLSNYDPEICVALYNAWTSGDTKLARQINNIIKPMADAMFIESSPSPVKFVSARRNLMSEQTRLPIVSLAQESKTAINTIVETFQANRDLVLAAS